ncbi:DUF5018-related domain-containing protein [Flavobacterium gilvum]|uniref:DUF5018 domain-containing protein n=1 Tax=Flavobacterium gilvum TaxID=1492737 RepID=A0AAC9I242_9FLAO|nr:hypothetical protein [Flavobacterium gilvum]AOW09144.1 hypothetical protein EM308_06290 [Flavobacterium gilvum]KFC60864.1 hypothetical protein FEM08_03510 [Flavobacterium gilvum]
MKLKNLFFLIFAMFSLSSCLNSDLEDLPEYEEANITNVTKVVHRYYDESNKWVDGSPVVTEKNMASLTRTIDNTAKTVIINCSVPPADATGSYNAAEKAKVSKTNLVVIFDISPAAIIVPLNGSPKLGVPGDWSAPRQYEVTAANGTKAVWTVTLNLTP